MIIYHYTYRITNLKLNKHYYGTRTTKVLPKLDLGIKYFSSSTDMGFKQDQKLNPLDYRYKILKIFETRECAIALEIKLHHKFNVGVNPNFYNKCKQTSKSFDVAGIKKSPEHREKISIGNKNKILSQETKDLLSTNKKEFFQNEDNLEKMKQVVKIACNTEEHKEKMREIGKHNWEDETYRIKQSNTRATNEYKSLMSEKISLACTNVDTKDKKSKSAKKQWENISHRELISKQRKDLWEDDTYRASMSGINSPKCKFYMFYKNTQIYYITSLNKFDFAKSNNIPTSQIEKLCAGRISFLFEGNTDNRYINFDFYGFIVKHITKEEYLGFIGNIQVPFL